MYEGPIKAADLAWGEETPILRQLRWTDLVARIAATRDLRAAPTLGQGGADDAAGSFASFHLDEPEKGQRAVNRDALSHGKLSRIHPSDTAKNADTGDREIS
jgi:hypothetical protein